MADIFLSYKRSDRATVAPIVALLQSQGWSVWWDTRIGAGETWDEVIERELVAASCVVVVWSADSVGSRWVRSEASDGLDRGVLVPVHIDVTKAPLEFKLIQSIDLVGWQGDASAAGAQSLIEAASNLLGGVPSQTTAEPLLPPMHSRAEESFELPRALAADRAQGENWQQRPRPSVFSRNVLWGLIVVLTLIVPSILWLTGWLGGPQTKAGRQPVADQSTSIKVADVKTVRVVPIEKTENASQYVAASVDPRQTAVGPQPSAVEKPPVVVPAPPPAAVLAPPPPPKVVEPPRPRIEDLVAEAKQRISMGDMAGARSVLANAQYLAPGPMAFALAETYDPNMLATWQTRGVPPEPEKAKALYMRAREFGDSRAQQRIDWLLGR